MEPGQAEFIHYCERASLAFWAEPVNAVTNAAFLLAALVAARDIARHRRHATQWDLWLLVALMACIGVGSFLWHTVAAPWAEAADVIPILLFVSVFLVAFLVRVAGLGAFGAVVGLLVFEGVNFGMPLVVPMDALSGSVGYAPTWLGLGGMACYAWFRARHRGVLLALAFGVFTVSLVLRTLDPLICQAWPLGTHFGWHLLNGVVLYLAVRALAVRETA